ncbi:MAG TPA: NAD-dependent epimerase/dehydratase family protein [Planctomycetota bacterium]|nr:NAD-dependent epimerase/dehydratase family protein [Planctomycetota bacterium]
MTTLVTGATGFVGINLVRRLVAKGEKVRIFARPSPMPRKGLEGLDVEQAAGDVTDAESVAAAMKGVRRVYHVAGLTSQGPWNSVRRRLKAVNVGGTDNVCEAARKEGVERLVHCSSVAAIGFGPLEKPATESQTWNLGRLASPYYDTKRDAEFVVQKHVEQGLDAVIVNPSLMIGPYDVKPTSSEVVLRAARMKKGIFFYPKQGGMNALDVEDAVFGHIAAMEKGKKGERYILGNENLTWRGLFTLANEVCGKPAPWLPLSLLPTYPVALVGNALGFFAPERFDSFNTAILRAGLVQHYVSPEKARRELGLPATPLKDAMKKALVWFQENGYLPPR